ncbi:MAG TPA: urate oxidase [Solirubrobacteraceae bacterium]|jgi:urate oxidase
MLGANRYGKSQVRVVKVARTPGRHTLRDLTVDVMLEGDFAAAHTRGDNRGLPATDTMRNTIYVLANRHPIDTLESFGRALVEHFMDRPAVVAATVRIREHPWERLGDHEHAFQRGYGGTRVATVSVGGVSAGVEDLLVLRTTGSGFEGFERDRYTTLPETDDRILATVVTATWEYGGAPADWHAVRDRLLEAFADHYSPSVQFTLHRMGEAVLDAHPEIERIHLSLPNRHHLLVDLTRFGESNDNAVFEATSEPFGLIEGTVERAPAAGT